MRIVIMGQSWLATETLKQLVARGHTPIAAMPDKRDRFESLANSLKIPIVNNLEDMPKCDVALAMHCHRYIPEHLLTRPLNGILAYHPSLLPRHRGRDAVHWTIAMKDPIAGGTVYLMDQGVDTGKIVSQDWCHVSPGDTPKSLWRRELGPMGVSLICSAIEKLNKNKALSLTKQPQNVATWEPALTGQKLNR